MKIAVVFLFVAFATLVQFQVSVAEEEGKEEESTSHSSLAKGSEKSLLLIRRKRWTWFCLYHLPRVSVMLEVVGSVEVTWKHTRKAYDYNDFFEHSLDIAKEVANKTIEAANEVATKTIDDIQKMTYLVIQKGEKILQEARQEANNILLNYAVEAVSNTCRKSFAIHNQGNKKSDAGENFKLLDKYINLNFNDNYPFKLLMKEDYPKCKLVHFSPNGFICNKAFCEKYGYGLHAFGICSPFACSCTDSGPDGLRCVENLIYDPTKQNCNFPVKVKICGFLLD